MPGIIILLIIGAAAGFLATRLMKVQTDIPTTVVIGMAGAVVAWVLLRSLAGMSGWIVALGGAVLGAVVLIWFWKTWISPKDR